MNYLTSTNINHDAVVGRLGNKLFIIAAGIGAAAVRKDYEFVIPTWQYQDDLPNVKIQTEGVEDLAPHTEPHFHFGTIPASHGNIQLNGYFQSEKYFAHIADEIRNYHFKPSKEIQEEVNSLFQHKGDAKMTSIHVRRGDYLTCQEAHPVCGMDYYNKAMERLDDVTDRFIVFSDDIQWCKENFKGEKVMFSEGRRGIVDLFMLAECDNHIISNSSYSWWGAWLCKHKNKKIIAPEKWFGPELAYHDKSDLYCDGWIII